MMPATYNSLYSLVMIYDLRSLLFILILLPVQSTLARTFHAEGSDLLLGVGAEQIAIGGAAVANAKDIYAIYWNPAGLAEMSSSQISVSKQLNSTLSPVNFLGIAIVNEKLNFSELKSTLGFALIPRLHASSTGHYLESDLQSMFLRYALPSLPGDFEGEIETKTRDYRLTWAVTPLHDPKWSLAFSLSRIECGSSFCGVSANDPGNYTIASGNATAYGYHMGAKYYYSDALTFGLNIEDVDTKLKVHVTTTDNNGTRKESYTVPLPRDISVGTNWIASPSLQLSLDYQTISGSYGGYNIDVQMFRGGADYRRGNFSYRTGLIMPLKINSTQVGDIKSKLPFPVVPTAGIGWQDDKVKVDFALYPHTLMSHHYNRIYLAADLSLSYQF